MNKLVKKVFGTVICNEKDAIELGKEVDEEILKLLRENEEAFEEEELDQIKNLMYESAYIAESAGFQLGMHYFLKLFLHSEGC